MNLREEEDLLDWLENHEAVMTCADFRKFVDGPGLVSGRSRTEQLAIMKHYMECRTCKAWAKGIAALATPAERSAAMRDVDEMTAKLRDAIKNDPEVDLDPKLFQ